MWNTLHAASTRASSSSLLAGGATAADRRLSSRARRSPSGSRGNRGAKRGCRSAIGWSSARRGLVATASERMRTTLGSLPTGSLRTEGASRGRAPRWPTTREAGQRRVRLPASLSNFAVVRLTCVRDLYEIFWCSFRGHPKHACLCAPGTRHAPWARGVLSGTPGVRASCIFCRFDDTSEPGK